MVPLREPEKRGKMTERFVEEYSEYSGFYIKPHGKCGNPSCGHYPIHERHIVRNPVSGDVKEIGSHCYQRWLQLQGMAVDPWFWQYQEALRVQALSTPGTVLVPKEQRKIYEEQRRKWLIKHKTLERIDIPISEFVGREQAAKYAEDRGGYLSGIFTVRGKKYWCLYLPKEE